MSAEGNKARAPRRQRKLKGFVRRCGQGAEPAWFNNVSPSGCCIFEPFTIGEWLVVMLPAHGMVEAQVRWSIGGRSGLRFTSPV